MTRGERNAYSETTGDGCTKSLAHAAVRWWVELPRLSLSLSPHWVSFCFRCRFSPRVQDILLATSPTALRTLHFYNNMSGDLGAKALAQVRIIHLLA